MPAVQSAYSETYRKGFPGMIVNSETYNKISRTAVGAIGFGQPVIRSGEHNCLLASQETLEAVAAAVAGGTGNGTMGAVTVSAGAKEGVYRLVIIEPASNAGTFRVEDPDGIGIGSGVVAVAFSAGGLAFTLADGATDFVAGDAFTITLTPSVATADLDILGLSVKDDTTGAEDTAFAAYDSVAIMTMGVMWVTAGATIVAGDLAYWNPASGKYTKTTTHLPVIVNGQHAKFDSAAVDTGMVRLALR